MQHRVAVQFWSAIHNINLAWLSERNVTPHDGGPDYIPVGTGGLWLERLAKLAKPFSTVLIHILYVLMDFEDFEGLGLSSSFFASDRSVSAVSVCTIC
jgi:hypothetical protein